MEPLNSPIDWLVFDLGGVLIDVAPAACLLIDDRTANVAGARAAGWQALLFTDCAALEHDLEALGIATGVSA
jgi:2-haloacid dehalogenase